MPRLNGYQLYERLRQNPDWITIPFIFLTARSLDSDIRYGKELGVDDYLTKPIQPEDLLATVQGKLRRGRQLARSASGPGASPATRAEDRPGQLEVGKLRLDAHQHRAWWAGQPLKLAAREFLLLLHLAQRADLVVSPQTLIKITHELETDFAEASGLLRPMIRSLRRKLGCPPGEMGCIENVRGVGYRLLVQTD